MTTDATEPTPERVLPAVADALDDAAKWRALVEQQGDENAQLRQQLHEARRELAVARDDVREALNRRMVNHKITAAHAEFAEERYWQLAGEVERIAATCVREGSRLDSGGGGLISAAENLRRALAATAPTDTTPTTRQLIEDSSLGTPEAKRLRDSVPDEVAQRIVAKASEPEPIAPLDCSTCDGEEVLRCLAHVTGDGCDEMTIPCPDCQPGSPPVDEPPLTCVRLCDVEVSGRHAKGCVVQEQAGSEAQEGAEGSALIAATEEKAEAIWRDGAGTHVYTLATRTTDVWVETARRLAEALDGRPTAQIDRLLADLERVTQERDEALRSRGIHQRAVNVAEQKLGEALGYDVSGRYPGMPLLVGQVADERRELLHLRAFAAERDALQATLDAMRENCALADRTYAELEADFVRTTETLDNLRVGIAQIATELHGEADRGYFEGTFRHYAEALVDLVQTHTDRSEP